jgi:pimeloyl-ACP methyl ester carboxylesterase
VPLAAVPASPSAARSADADYGRSVSPDWRAVPWPRHAHSLEVDGAPIRYVDLGGGGGAPVVFVHGLGGNWQNWLENLPRIAQERRALALDLPGFGESPPPREDISISRYASLIDAWLERLGVERAVVVGNSMGGFVSAELAIEHPSRVERLVLAAAAGISVAHLRRQPTLALARLATAAGALSASRNQQVVGRRRLRHLMLATVVRHPALLEPDLLLEVLRGSGKPGYLDALEALIGYDFRERLGRIGCPTLIVWGREDALVPVRDAAEFERSIPRSRTVVLDDTGHVPMIERPETFNRLLVEFLSENSGGEGALGRRPDVPGVLGQDA